MRARQLFTEQDQYLPEEGKGKGKGKGKEEGELESARAGELEKERERMRMRKEKGKKTFWRHEQKDGGLACDEGVAELVFARGTGPGRSPFMAQADGSDGLAAVRSWRGKRKVCGVDILP